MYARPSNPVMRKLTAPSAAGLKLPMNPPTTASNNAEIWNQTRLASQSAWARLLAMSTVDVATFKAHAEELVAKAIAGEATVIEQNGKRAVLLPCEGAAPDFELDPQTDELLRQRVQAPGREVSA